MLIAALVYGGYSIYQRRKLDKLQQVQTPSVVAPAPKPQPPMSVPSAATPSSATQGVPSTPAPSANATAPTTNPKTAPSTSSVSLRRPIPRRPRPNHRSQQARKRNLLYIRYANIRHGNKPQNATGSAFELKIKVNKQSWVSIKADGKTLVNTTLSAGTERSFKASDKIEVILGNLAAWRFPITASRLKTSARGKTSAS